MYYAEKWIDGKLFWRGTPFGEWIEADAAKLTARLLASEAEVKRLRRELIDSEKEMRAEMRDTAAEASWKERQGEDYGSY